MINPGGTNEKFAREHLSHSTIIVHQKNEEIPELIANGEADVMVTEITEAPYYVNSNKQALGRRIICIFLKQVGNDANNRE